MNDTTKRVLTWMLINPVVLQDRRSISTIIDWMELGKVRSLGNPLRPFECRAIVEFLEEFPEYEARLGEMAELQRDWSVLAEHWNDIKAVVNKRDGSYGRLMDALCEEATDD